MNKQHDPAAILQTAFGFWSSKVLLTAIEFGLFTKLAGRRLTAGELGGELGLHPRGTYDFFDALVSMKFFHLSGVSSRAKMASTGQAGTQAPQSMHSSGWI